MEIETLVYSRIGMALVAAQRVEYLTSQLLIHLAEFDSEVYSITSAEFLSKSQRAINARNTLGSVFRLLKLNPRLVIANELDEYVDMRNTLAHRFWETYLNGKSEKHSEHALKFCNELGKRSEQLESFFRGFLYFLAMRHVQDRSHLDATVKNWENDFEYFIDALNQKQLNQ
jgi:hypothetical protein